MPTWAYILVGLAAFPASLAGAVALLRRLPSETRKLTVETVDVNVKIAGDLRDDALHDRQQAREDLTALRREFDQYRADTDARLAEMAVEVRAARAGETEAKRQAESYRAENEELRGRVDELETEVAQLKADRP